MRDPADFHEPITALVTLENTHGLSMGQPLSPAYAESVSAGCLDQMPTSGGAT